MTQNMGFTDRIIRVALAAMITVLYFLNAITGTIAILLLILLGILIMTSLFSFCPLYLPFGISTKKKLKH
jgi:hypothetical protein